MIIRAGTGWQYALADLSLILFLVTASALSVSGKSVPAPPPPSPPIAAALESEPVAVWSAGDDAPPLAAWLEQVGGDPRLEVRVVVRYSDGEREAAVAQALQLATAGGARASRARVLIEPGDKAGASVSLFYAREAQMQSAVPLAR
jgi:hypothetical protein